MWEIAADKACRDVFIIGPSIVGPVKIIYTMYFPDKRNRDLFNYEKLISDILVKNGIIIDDNHNVISEGIVRFGGYDKTMPRVEVDIFKTV